MSNTEQPGRRRSPRSHEAILTATIELLEQKGYVSLTIEGIAARAGVGKQTIYRWWPSKAALVIEAYGERLNQRTPAPDTGSVRNDLEVLLTKVFSAISEAPSPCAMIGLMAEAQTDNAIAEQFYSGFIRGRRERVREILERGIRRGEIHPSTDTDVAVDALFGPLWYRMMVGRALGDADFASSLVRQTLQGIHA
ncbi:TetR family transcriptional regulator [Pseudodesulfovibrio cashew]|uniref:TetR family transcriptional regulator n=1 Tax=Pseudodesulfovibrio cashew TaxID=2678688 RepID=A0A6I6JJA3_9BACT|nr:TetR/AcrR family transcriptional regulator [Pseudodesulfovibrio cashew]QGY40392.1 TetR family transcriptional regulator [Pseudodesulfovibrio cashew]